MQSSCNKDDQSTNQSLSPFFITCSSLWNSTEQLRYSPSKSIITGPESSPDEFCHVKQSESGFQEHDSSSTLSTCQSHYAMADAARNRTCVQNIGSQRGSDGTHARHADRNQRSPLLYSCADYAFGQVHLDYNKSTACIPFPCAESYFGGLVAAYGPNALIYPHVVGMAPARVPLPPLECAESIPVFVNAKQYRAIIRRREIRAKLEGQNKILKFRKPYLHESRHVHALKRARGSGGRFLNTKNIKQSKLSSPSYCKDLSYKKFAQQTSTLSGSDVASIFHEPEIKVSTSSLHLDLQVGEDLGHSEAGNNRLFFMQ